MESIWITKRCSSSSRNSVTWVLWRRVLLREHTQIIPAYSDSFAYPILRVRCRCSFFRFNFGESMLHFLRQGRREADVYVLPCSFFSISVSVSVGGEYSYILQQRSFGDTVCLLFLSGLECLLASCCVTVGVLRSCACQLFYGGWDAKPSLQLTDEMRCSYQF